MWLAQAHDIVDVERCGRFEKHGRQFNRDERSERKTYVKPGILMPPVSALILSSASLDARSIAS